MSIVADRGETAGEPAAAAFEADIAAVDRIDAVPKILEVICRATGMGFSAVARVTEERWICCAVRDEIAFGLKPGSELKIETTICHEIRQCLVPVAIDQVSISPVYSGHHTPAMYGFESYISVPIILSDGSMFGTLCAIDPRPARVEAPHVLQMFKLFAEMIASHLESERRITANEASLLDANKTAELREQFIAVLGHDLRNPLASISGGIRLIRKAETEAKANDIAAIMQRSVDRMARLIDNVLDFARGRMGGGILLKADASQPLQPMLEQVISELRVGHPDSDIRTSFAITQPVKCDRNRLAQLFSNLLANALTHGDENTPVEVSATTGNGMFELRVTNKGKPIPAAAMADLFKPFARGSVHGSLQGLGLGLYIASEIARAHGGTVSATSTPDSTDFIFCMPVG